MALTSDSTIEDAFAQYEDNLSYEDDSSLVTAKAFREACRYLVLHLPKSSAIGGGARGGGQDMELDPAAIQRQLEEVKQFIDMNPTVSRGSTSWSNFDYYRW